LISYDIENDKKRRKISNQLKDYGIRVQYSVFEVKVSKEEYNTMVEGLMLIFNTNIEKRDSLRIYKLCSNCCEKVVSYGEFIDIDNKFEEGAIVI
jgi:CRISPR-associated protein Cas2